MNWIKCSEKLPEKAGKVLVYTEGHTSCHIGIYKPIDRKWEMYYYDGVSSCDDRNITHWMPLPEPPKE